MAMMGCPWVYLLKRPAPQTAVRRLPYPISYIRGVQMSTKKDRALARPFLKKGFLVK